MAQVRRISSREALELYEQGDFHELTARAAQITAQLHPGNIRTYVVERNINYTNVCRARCSFCAFSVSPKSAKAYALNAAEIAAKIEPLVALGGTQILLQGGLNPNLPLEWYEQMLGSIKADFKRLHIHAFSPPEINFFSHRFELPIQKVLERLRNAGLDTLPGGGAEILVDRVRRLISPAKCSSKEWLDVMRQAHQLGISSTATMMFGHVERSDERIEHLELLRQLQDESLARRQRGASAGIFTAFTCWPFQPGLTRLSQWDRFDPDSDSSRGSEQLLLAGAIEQLKMTALARIYLDNIRNIQASWVTQGYKIGQLSLLIGCNDAGSLMMEENVVAAAGTTFTIGLEELRRMISQAGFTPVQRDCYYNMLDTGSLDPIIH